MKKLKTTKNQLLEIIAMMTEEQFDQFAKENNREINQLVLWGEGVEYEAKSTFRIAHEIMKQVVCVEELAAYCADENAELAAREQLAIEQHKLNTMFDDLENKADSFGAVVTMLEKDCDKYEALANICKAKVKRTENQIATIKKNITNIMQGLELEKIKGTFFTLSVGKPTRSVVLNEMTDEEIHGLPKEFLRVKTEIDKTAVKAALDDGQSLAWAALIERRSLRIT
jgi:hypothetical protein